MTLQNKPSAIISLILPIYLPSILISIGNGMIILIIPLLAVDLSKSYETASLIFAMLGVGALTADIPSGFLISRLGIKKVMLLGLILISLASVTAGLINDTLIVGIVMFFLGVGRGLVLLSRMTYITNATIEERGRVVTINVGMVRLGTLLGTIIGGFIAKIFGFNVALVIAGIIICSASVFVVFISSENGQVATNPKKNPFKTIKNILIQFKSVFLTAGIAVVGLRLLLTARMVIVPFWGNAIGLDAAEIGLIIGIYMLLELTMIYPVGVIMDRYGRKWITVSCITIFAFSFALIPLSNDFSSLLIVVLLSGVGNGLGSGIFSVLGADFSPSKGRNEFLGVWRVIGDIGHTSAPFLVGLLTGFFTLASASVFTAGIGLCSAMIMLFFVKESKNITRGVN
jgi:MFS family permease